MATVFIALGANLGDRRENLRSALRLMPPRIRVVAVSSLYETEPVTPGGEVQPLYYNAAARLETEMPPADLLAAFKGIEAELGRDLECPRWSPRTIDIDLLLYGDEVIEEEGLIVPHPLMAERAFVLMPLAEIAGDVVHPVIGRTIADFAWDVGDAGVRRVEDAGWFVSER